MDNQKINIVNPLNPNEIIRIEVLTQNNVETVNEDIVNEQVVEPVVQEEKPKKKMNPIIFIILIALLGLGIGGYFLITNYLNSGNNPEDPIDTPVVKVISLNDISNSFNNNIGNYALVENGQISSLVTDNKIIVNIQTTSQITKYEFTLNDRKLTSVLANDDIIGYAITIYMFSAVSEYYDLNYSDVVTYLNDNINDLSLVNNIEIENLEQIKNISINVDEAIIIQ